MERFYQNPAVRTILALVCCALWGSAFPCVKIGYEMFEIEGAGSEILFAGYRFFLAGVLTYGIACVLERGLVKIRRSSIPYVCGQGILQTTIQYVCCYIGLSNTTGAKGSVINASNAFFAIIMAHFLIGTEKITWKKAVGQRAPDGDHRLPAPLWRGASDPDRRGCGRQGRRIYRRLVAASFIPGAFVHRCVYPVGGAAEI